MLSSLWGCGPEQSAYDRDQQQVLAQQAFFKAQIMPYIGSYYGLATSTAGLSYQVELNIGPNSTQAINSGTYQATNVSLLKGQWSVCKGSECFGPNKIDGNDVTDSEITSSSINTQLGEVTLVTTPLSTNCTTSNAQACAPATVVFHWNANDHTQIIGTFNSSAETNTTFVLTKE